MFMLNSRYTAQPPWAAVLLKDRYDYWKSSRLIFGVNILAGIERAQDWRCSNCQHLAVAAAAFVSAAVAVSGLQSCHRPLYIFALDIYADRPGLRCNRGSRCPIVAEEKMHDTT